MTCRRGDFGTCQHPECHITDDELAALRFPMIRGDTMIVTTSGVQAGGCKHRFQGWPADALSVFSPERGGGSNPPLSSLSTDAPIAANDADDSRPLLPAPLADGEPA